MTFDFSKIVVIGVSTRSLFNLEKENNIFERPGQIGCRKYQLDHEQDPLEPGTALYLIQSLLELNLLVKNSIMEVVGNVCLPAYPFLYSEILENPSFILFLNQLTG